jgi:hypothetical protein
MPNVNPLWEIVTGGGPMGLLFLIMLAIISGQLVPRKRCRRLD